MNSLNKWNMVVDVERCENCYNCFISAKDEHVGNDFPGYAAPQPEHGHEWIALHTFERGQASMIEANFMPTMCNHCDDPPCMAAARDGAVRKREDGIVLVDPVKSRGQRAIVEACPYGALFWNEDLQIPQGWIFDAHLLDKGWAKTRAEQVCPTGALRSMKVSDREMARMAEAEGLRVLKPELGTRPRVYYRNLHLADSCFVGGTLVDGALGDVIEGAQVSLSGAGGQAFHMLTDCFGDFKIDGLVPGAGEWSLSLSAGGRIATRSFPLESSLYLGIITI